MNANRDVYERVVLLQRICFSLYALRVNVMLITIGLHHFVNAFICSLSVRLIGVREEFLPCSSLMWLTHDPIKV
jgi:hypothetical protein